jgi:hypothetical protein
MSETNNSPSVIRTVFMSAIGLWLIFIAFSIPIPASDRWMRWVGKIPLVSLGVIILYVEAWLWRSRNLPSSGKENYADD